MEGSRDTSPLEPVKNLSVDCLFGGAVPYGREATLCTPVGSVQPGFTYPANELLSSLRGRDELAQCLEGWAGQT